MLLQSSASICISLDLSTLSTHQCPTQGAVSQFTLLLHGGKHSNWRGPGPYFRKQHSWKVQPEMREIEFSVSQRQLSKTLSHLALWQHALWTWLAGLLHLRLRLTACCAACSRKKPSKQFFLQRAPDCQSCDRSEIHRSCIECTQTLTGIESYQLHWWTGARMEHIRIINWGIQLPNL